MTNRPRKKRQKASREDRVFTSITMLLIVLMMLIILYPLWFVLIASFSSPVSVFAGKVWIWPMGFNLEGYRRIFMDAEIFTGYRNTIVYTILGTGISIVLTLSAAYPLSRRKLYGRNALMGFYTFTMFFNGGLIPTYLIVKGLGLYNNLWVMILVGSLSVYNIIVARTFLQSTIADEIYEAAEIDGANDVLTFFMIVLPLSAPILAVLTLFYAVGFWNNYFTGLIYLKERSRYPLQLFLREILVINTADSLVEAIETDMNKVLVKESVKYGVIIVSSVPMLILYPFLQRFFVKGVMIGAIKG